MKILYFAHENVLIILSAVDLHTYRANEIFIKHMLVLIKNTQKFIIITDTMHSPPYIM